MAGIAPWLFCLAATAIAQSANAQSASYLICTFTSGVVTDLSPVPSTNPTEDSPLMLVFREIDMTAGTATLVGNVSADGVQVSAIQGLASFSFIEVTQSGNVNTTSVFPAEGSSVAPAVTSRHVAIPGGSPFISQLFGSCRRG